jgi:23S rRNA (adenine2503-C2)-methyltransferase
MSACPLPLLDHSLNDFGAQLQAAGLPRFRARQVWSWIFRHRAESFEHMTDLPRLLRQELAESWQIFTGRVVLESVAPDGTEKVLIEWPDGKRVESVLLHEAERHTVCLSTQVGCGMGCVFCASGLRGVERNLAAGEMIEQVLRLRNRLPAGQELTNIVVMGMGESLANFDNLISALDSMCSAEGLGLSPRRVTISTVGLPDRMRKLADLDVPYHMAVSLHAPTEALRNELVPINDKVGLTSVMEAADYYFNKTGRQITYEYVLLRGVNDRRQDAHALGELLAQRKAHVNLIPYNPVESLVYQRPTAEEVRSFAQAVRDHGVSVTVRKTKGRPIDAACGQLRRRGDAVGAGNDQAVSSKL